jgi:hypothetical protein
VFNPIGGPSDDLCPAPFNQAACVAALTAAGDIPIRDVLAGPPQQITGPLANEGADSSFTGIDFVPDVFVGGPVQPGAALYSLEGDFGFSPPNSSNPDAEIGQINFLTASEKCFIAEINETKTSYPRDTAIDQIFEQQVANHPNKPAISFENTTITYGELNRRAERSGEKMELKEQCLALSNAAARS